MKKIIAFCAVLLAVLSTQTPAQVGIGTNTPDESALLEIKSEERGLLIPRMTSEQRDAIVQPARGLMIYNTDDNTFWYYNGSRWISVVNSGVVPESTSFIAGTESDPTPNLISLLNRTVVGDSSGVIWDSGGDSFHYANNEDYRVYLYANNNCAIGYRLYITYAIMADDSLIIEDYESGRTIAVYTNSPTTSYDTLYTNSADIILIFKSNSTSTAEGFTIAFNQICHLGAQDSEPSVTGPWYYRPANYSIAGGLHSAPNEHREMGKYSISYGYGNDASGENSISIGALNRASGRHAIALGFNNLATETSSVAIGYESEAITPYGFALGRNIKTIGIGSFGTGFNNRAAGLQTAVFGENNQSIGTTSMTMGESNISYGFLSTTMGHNNINKYFASLVIGRYNDTTSHANSYIIWDPGDPIFVVGNGTSSFRSNALTLYKNGNLTIAGTLTQNSDARLKRNIRPLTDVVDKLIKISGYQYNWDTPYSDTDELNIGLLAQEIEKVLPELIRKDGRGVMSVNYSGMIPYLLEGFKTLKAELEELQQTLYNLKQNSQ